MQNYTYNREQRRKSLRMARKKSGPQNGLIRHIAAQGQIGGPLALQSKAVREYGMPPSDKRVAAAHEAGHIVVSMAMGGVFKEGYLTQGELGWEGFSSVDIACLHGNNFDPRRQPRRAWLLSLTRIAGLAGEYATGLWHPASSMDEFYAMLIVSSCLSPLAGVVPADVYKELLQTSVSGIHANKVAFSIAASCLEQNSRMLPAEAAQLPVSLVDLDTLVPAWLEGAA
jgi:hypothetical protein